MGGVYEVGDRIRIRTATPFQDAAGVAFDPDTIRFEVRPPGSTTAVYEYGEDDNVSRLADGDYACDVDVDVAGTWQYRAAGQTESGENRGADQGYFVVRRRNI